MQTKESMKKFLETKKAVGCVIMASGMSKRFGTNKLLYEIQGKTLIQRILDSTAGLFDRRAVVTRTPEVAELCREQDVAVIFHELPGRNDALRLGIQYMSDMEFCLCCPCDQPFLKRETLRRFSEIQELKTDDIVRLASDIHPGAPILFGEKYYEELCSLPEKAGGSCLAEKYADKVSYIFAEEKELADIDTPEDLKKFNLYG